MRLPTIIFVFTSFLISMSFATLSWGHAFPDHSDPGVGSKIDTSPDRVRIWFNSELEAEFSTIRVEDSNEKQVDKGNCHVDESNPKLLEVGIPALSRGTYHVKWVAVGRDGHRTQGDFSFTVK